MEKCVRVIYRSYIYKRELTGCARVREIRECMRDGDKNWSSGAYIHHALMGCSIKVQYSTGIQYTFIEFYQI